MSAERFPQPVLEQMAAAREVEVETSRGPERAVHRTVIWIVVTGDERVLIRTYLGRESRWFREATANPRGAIWIGSERLGVRFRPATDAESVAALDAGYRAKYRRSRSVDAMLEPALADTTLELLPDE